MKKVDFYRVLSIGGLTALVIIYAVLWLQMIGSRPERTGADFIGFYSAARIAQAEGPAHIYIPDLQQKIEQQLVTFKLAPGQVLLFNHLPYLVPLLRLIVNGDYINSFIRWAIILLILDVIDTGVLLTIVARPETDRQTLLVLALGTFLFYPMFTSLMNGQDTVFLLLGAAIWLWGSLFGKDIYAGLGLALMTIRPQLAILLALPFLFRRKRVLVWYLIGAAVLGAGSILYLGLAGTLDLLNILAVSARGDSYGLHPEAMPTLTGLLHRIIPGLSGSAIQIVGLGGYFLAMAALCVLWYKSSRIGPKQIGLAVIIGVFFIPYLHYHDLTLLLIPLYCLLWMASPRIDKFNAILPLMVSFLLLVGFFWGPATYLTVFIVMIGLAYFLLKPAWLIRGDQTRSNA